MRTVLFLAAVTLAGLTAWGCYNVWPPDVISHAHRVVGERSFAGDHRLRVVQFWNGVDFYSTHLEVVTPTGKQTFVLDGDDRKRWSCVFTETGTQVHVVVGGAADGAYDLERGTFIRADGQLSEPLASND